MAKFNELKNPLQIDIQKEFLWKNRDVDKRISKKNCSYCGSFFMIYVLAENPNEQSCVCTSFSYSVYKKSINLCVQAVNHCSLINSSSESLWVT